MEVPVDLCLEILTRLDAKSVATSKSVSRDWLRFLSHPDFAKSYSRRRRRGFFYSSSQSYREKLRYVSVGDDEHEPVVEPSSCLGFLESPAILYDSVGGLLHWVTSWNDHFISNPLTQKFIKLDWPFQVAEYFACGIACDPSVSVHFEIVVLVKKPNLNLEPWVFYSGTMQWTKSVEIGGSSSVLVPYEETRGIFLEGFLFWETKENRVLCYQVRNREARIIELPQELNPNYNQERGCLGLCSGRLHYGRIRDRRLTVWVYSGRVNRWEVHQRIDFDGHTAYPAQVLAFAEDCGGVWMNMGKRIIYWCFNGGIRDAFEVQRDGLQPSMFFPFVRSIAWPFVIDPNVNYV